MTRRFFSAALAAACLLTAAGCAGRPPESSRTESGAYYTFTDDAGREVVLKAAPQKVAVLFSSFADIWKTAGGTVAVTVGESVERGFADESAVLVDAGAGKTINTESLIAAEPDLIIGSLDIEAQADAVKLAAQAGIPAAAFKVEAFADYLRVLKICTAITGNAEAYETYGTAVQERVEEILQKAQQSGQADQREILFIRAGSKASATKAKTAEDHFACAMLQEMGIHNIAEDAPVLLDGLSLEEILLRDPDYIFVSTMGDEQAAKDYLEGVFAGEEWQVLTAIREKRYTFLPKELFHFKPNARWDEAYRYLYDLLYPSA